MNICHFTRALRRSILGIVILQHELLFLSILKQREPHRRAALFVMLSKKDLNPFDIKAFCVKPQDIVVYHFRILSPWILVCQCFVTKVERKPRKTEAFRGKDNFLSLAELQGLGAAPAKHPVTSSLST